MWVLSPHDDAMISRYSMDVTVDLGHVVGETGGI